MSVHAGHERFNAGVDPSSSGLVQLVTAKLVQSLLSALLKWIQHTASTVTSVVCLAAMYVSPSGGLYLHCQVFLKLLQLHPPVTEVVLDAIQVLGPTMSIKVCSNKLSKVACSVS